MTVWYKMVMEKLRSSGLFGETNLVGAKVRASIDETRFLDIHFDHQQELLIRFHRLWAPLSRRQASFRLG